jgi:hypothetical protein
MTWSLYLGYCFQYACVHAGDVGDAEAEIPVANVAGTFSIETPPFLSPSADSVSKILCDGISPSMIFLQCVRPANTLRTDICAAVSTPSHSHIAFHVPLPWHCPLPIYGCPPTIIVVRVPLDLSRDHGRRSPYRSPGMAAGAGGLSPASSIVIRSLET